MWVILFIACCSAFDVLTYRPLVIRNINNLRKTNNVQEYMIPDLIQEGMLGLCMASNNFNKSKQVNFGYYCIPYVKH